MPELNDEERAELERFRAEVEAQGPQADAGESLAKMSTDRAEPLPAEAEHDRLMAEFKAMSERIQALEAEAGQNKRDYQAAVAKLGPPAVAPYAAAIHDKLVSLKAAHPDAPPGHFDGVISKAAPLGDAAREVIAGRGHVSDITDQLPDVVTAVDRFITRTHGRKWGKPIDFSALAADLEDATDAAEAADKAA